MCGESETTTTSNSLSGPEQWMKDTGRGIFEKAQALINEADLKPYAGPRVADYGTDFQGARNAAASLGDTSALSSSRSVLDQLKGAITGDVGKSVTDFMDPYLQEVLGPALRKINEQGATNMANINKQATISGAFGDASTGVQRAQSTRDLNQLIADTTGKAYSDAYSAGLGQVNKVRDQAAGLSGAYDTLSGAETSRASTLSQLLAGLADKSRTVDQAKLDAEKAKYEEQAGRPLDSITKLMALLNLTPHDTSESGTKTQTSPDNGGFGLLGSLLGAFL